MFSVMMGRRTTYHLETLRQLRIVEVENAALRQQLELSQAEVLSLRAKLAKLVVRAKLVIRGLSRQQPKRTSRRLAV